MSQILTPGYLRWDGTKYVLDHDVEIVGPAGSIGPIGPVGPAGPPGPFGNSAGDLSGNYSGPISVIGLTGTSGVLPFGVGVVNPTITQTSTAGTTGQTMTLKAQPAVLFGGNLSLQSGTGTTAGIIQFIVGNTNVGQFDSFARFGVGPNAASTFNVFTSTPLPGSTTYLFSNNASGRNVTGTYIGAANDFGSTETINYSAGSNATTGVRVIASGASGPIGAWNSQGAIDQIGSPTSALVFTTTSGSSGSTSTTGRIFQSGAWAIGDSSNNNSSTSAQAGMSGAIINIAGVNGTFTSTSSQATIWNAFTGGGLFGNLVLQGHVGVSLLSNTTTVASTTTTKFITSQGRRIKVTTTTASPYNVLTTDEVISVGTIASPITVNLPASPAAGDTYSVKDANGSATSFNITVSGNGNNIDGASTYVLTTNYMVVTFVYDGTKWLAIIGPPGPTGPQGIPGSSFNISSTVTTVDATTTTLATLALADLSFTGIDVIVIAKKVGTADGAKFNLSMSYIRQGGAPVAVGTVTSYDQRSTATASTWTATITTSGNNAIVQVVGAVATTVDWEAQLQYVVVS